MMLLTAIYKKFHDSDLVDSNDQDIETSTCTIVLERPMDMFANDLPRTVDTYFMLDEVLASRVPLRLEGEATVSVETTQLRVRNHVSQSIRF